MKSLLIFLESLYSENTLFSTVTVFRLLVSTEVLI
nr:MAG TPA: hypothetical protein [Caudoviricetes sp.]